MCLSPYIIADAKPEIVGYVCAAVNSVDFYRKQEIAWIPEMCLKYPKELLDKDDLSDAAKVTFVQSVHKLEIYLQVTHRPQN